ncbi:MAG: PadR family transcriptional regulator [Actinomycetota bacterium]|nr:PadR family transcriptional regulator [Actinomycetota bacterium]
MSRSRDPVLTTTTYALLSHLSLKPWSAYELAVQRVRYFRFFWPRAQRGIYIELKRLHALGLAEAEITYVGRRARTVYTITDNGRQALEAWLDQPVSPIAVEFEGLLRLFSAPLGTKDQLLSTLGQVRADVAEMTALNDGIITEYADGRAPFQHQAYVRTLVVDFVTQFLAGTEAWVERTITEVDTWDDMTSTGKPLRTLERLSHERLGRRPPSRHD